MTFDFKEKRPKIHLDLKLTILNERYPITLFIFLVFLSVAARKKSDHGVSFLIPNRRFLNY